MKHTEESLPRADQQSTYFQCWLPEAAPKAIVLLVHGAGEHSGRYGHVGSSLLQTGWQSQRWIIVATGILVAEQAI